MSGGISCEGDVCFMSVSDGCIPDYFLFVKLVFFEPFFYFLFGLFVGGDD